MKLSIIIAAYNVEKYIEKCIFSCLNQNIGYKEFEILVINDGSTDNTLNAVQKLKQKHPNILILSQKNMGLGAARNTGLSKARGEYLWFIDGDDYIKENCLQVISDELTRYSLDVLVLNYAIVKEDGQLIRNNCNQVLLPKKVSTGGEFYKKNFQKSYSVLFIFKTDLFIKNKIFFKERLNMQDSEILPKLLYHSSRLSYLDKVCYYYVQHADSYTNSSNGQKRYNYFSSIVEVRNSLNDFAEKIADTNPDLKEGINHKSQTLHHVVFNHLIFFTYQKEWLLKIIKLLRENDFYPLKHHTSGKMKIIKWGLNHFPIFTKKIIDNIQQMRRNTIN